MSLYKDLAHPDPKEERAKHKQKRLVPFPDSSFIAVKCKECSEKAFVFSHSQTVIQCKGCSTVMAQPTGGRVRISQNCEIKDIHY